MKALNQKICDHFEGLVVRKDLVKTVKGNAIVPSYVLEYLLGQYCATSDEDSVQSGIETVREILMNHYVHRNEAGLIRANIKERGRYKVIDKISVALNDKKDCYEAKFANLGIKEVLIDSGTIKAHPKLLVSGVWCIADVEYEHTEDRNVSPWILSTIKPIQLSNFDYDSYLEARRQFTTDEWIDLLIQSIGFNPEMLGKRSKLTQLIRLIPFCERNYNLIELGPKGTGKSHIYSEFSPHGILISGGEVTVPKLFVNNSTGKLGLVGYWDTVAFDEFAGKEKSVNKGLVDIMKNYMANKSFSRGVETLGAEASMVFVGNTQHTIPYMLKHSDLFVDLPDKFYDSAFLDRLHFYIPGWEVDIIRGEMFSNDHGFVVDYIAEILRSLRNHDYSDKYKDKFTLSSNISTRDRDGIHKTFSGLMKILFPHEEATDEEIEEVLKFSIEGRKRVKDQLMRIDKTYAEVEFSYTDTHGKVTQVETLEELQYPDLAAQTATDTEEPVTDSAPHIHTPVAKEPIEPALKEEELVSGEHLVVPENIKGYSYNRLFAKHLKGSKRIVIRDPYIRMFHQVKNILELVAMVNEITPDGEEAHLHLVTQSAPDYCEKQDGWLKEVQASSESSKVTFTFAYENESSFHARSIQSDNGWKISLDRGLDIFQRYESGAFSLSSLKQEERLTKECEITYLKVED
ncbi:MAG: BREX system Lon protease-like protein BrxL [Rubritalea sp.]|uniref:BREX system Lon protease-like protein BrxL n=1 Tax=Rubritalea sp. TaxID=2109375 RepID=UPI003242F589